VAVPFGNEPAKSVWAAFVRVVRPALDLRHVADAALDFGQRVVGFAASPTRWAATAGGFEVTGSPKAAVILSVCACTRFDLSARQKTGGEADF